MLDDDPALTSAYAGRWVALVRGRVVAQGNTREQAFQAARRSRSKEPVEIRFMPIKPINNPILDVISARLTPEVPVYLVGGAVRDAVLGRTTHDLDFATPHGLKTAQRVADALSAAYFPLEKDFDIGRVVVRAEDGSRTVLDFSGYRGADLDADLRGRDFTINAIAMDIHTGEIIDPLGGVSDIRDKRIRVCSETAFSADPLRVLRAIRQAAAFDFLIDPPARGLMKSAVSLLPGISAERLRDELFKILEGPRPDVAMRALEMLGVLPHLLPELVRLKGVEQSAPHVYDVWSHTLAVLRHLEAVLQALAPAYDETRANADLMNGLLVMRLGRYREQLGQHMGPTLNPDRSARSLLFFAALYHDIDKPRTRTVEESGRVRFLGHEQLGARTAQSRAQALHLSNDEIERLVKLIDMHMRMHAMTDRQLKGAAPSRKAVYRFFRDAGETGVDLVLLALADARATYEHTMSQELWAAELDVSRMLLEAWYEKAEEVISPPQLINGNDLLTILKQKPGPGIGKLLEAVRENQAAGFITTREEALAFSRGWYANAHENAHEIGAGDAKDKG